MATSKDLYRTLTIFPFLLCFIGMISWTCFSSAPSSIPLTIFWVLEIVLPLTTTIGFLVRQNHLLRLEPQPLYDLTQLVLNTIQSALCSLTLSWFATWLAIRFGRSFWMWLELKPLNDADFEVNTEEGMSWVCAGFGILLISGIWASGQYYLFWVGTLGWFERVRRSWVEGAELVEGGSREEEGEQELGVLNKMDKGELMIRAELGEDAGEEDEEFTVLGRRVEEIRGNANSLGNDV